MEEQTREAEKQIAILHKNNHSNIHIGGKILTKA